MEEREYDVEGEMKKKKGVEWENQCRKSKGVVLDPGI